MKIIKYMSKLSRKIAKKTTLREKDIRMVLDQMCECMIEDLCETGSTTLPLFGTFSVKEQQPHYIRNIQTGKKELTKDTAPMIKFEAYRSLREKCDKKEDD